LLAGVTVPPRFAGGAERLQKYVLPAQQRNSKTSRGAPAAVAAHVEQRLVLVRLGRGRPAMFELLPDEIIMYLR
jgi:hypothetical protein